MSTYVLFINALSKKLDTLFKYQAFRYFADLSSSKGIQKSLTSSKENQQTVDKCK